MSEQKPRNIAASIHQRLLNESRRSSRAFNELVQAYAMERFLYRLSQSSHARKFILKGALMLRAWQAPLSRPTMDIDLLGRTSNDIDAIVTLMREICGQQVEPDGLVFDAASVSGQAIAEDAEYEGVRVLFRGSLGTTRIAMQIDIGFGDTVSPITAELPTILPMPAPRLNGYSREATIAEKSQAMVKLGLLNSRMKDYYDIWLLSRQFHFDGEVLTEAIRRTFAARQTDVVAAPIALSSTFASDPQKMAHGALVGSSESEIRADRHKGLRSQYDAMEGPLSTTAEKD